MKTAITYFLFLFPLFCCGCQPADAQVSQQDVLNYLDGRPLVLPVDVVADHPVTVQPGDKVITTRTTGQPLKIAARTITMERPQISALRIGKAEPLTGLVPTEKDPGPVWMTAITFLYDDSSGTYAVEAMVEHALSGGQRVFLGYRVNKVAKQ
jgi:hypothetical protein